MSNTRKKVSKNKKIAEVIQEDQKPVLPGIREVQIMQDILKKINLSAYILLVSNGFTDKVIDIPLAGKKEKDVMGMVCMYAERYHIYVSHNSSKQVIKLHIGDRLLNEAD